jgi:Bacterial membrane protein YfhO
MLDPGAGGASDSIGARLRRRLAGVAIGCSAALLAPLAWPLFTRRVFVSDDLAWFHLPLRYLYQQALQAGDTVLWTPSIFAGLYVHGEGQLGAFHPLHQLLYRLLPLDVAFNLEFLASYLAAFAGMVWFLRRLHLSYAAACVGAMLFAFSGFMLLHHPHLNVVAVVAHMPWLLAGADAVIVEERSRAWSLGFAALAVGLGSAFLLGFPQAVWWDAIAVGAFAIYRAGETRRWRRLLACAGAVTIGVLLGGIQLLPSADAVAQSVRANVSPDFALIYSMHPANLLQLWSPRVFTDGAYNERETMLFHEFGIYSGAILPVALCWMWSRRMALPGRRLLIAGATMLVVFGVWLALGRYGGLAGQLAHVPVLQSLRAPVRYIVLAQFALAVLAALTIDDLIAIAGGRADVRAISLRMVWVPLAFGAATLLIFNAGLLTGRRPVFAAVSVAAPGVALIAVVTLLVVLAARRVQWALPALVVVTAADLAMWGLGFVLVEPPRSVAAIAHAAPAAPRETDAAYASASDNGLYRSNQLVLRGYRLTTGYVGLYPAARHQLDGDEALRLSGTRWRFTPDGVRRPVDGAAARVRLLERDGSDAAGSVRMAIDRPGRLVAHVEAPGPRILAFTERFHAGWSATIDGRRLQMVRVEGDFLGCVVDAGVHRVVLQFMPRSFVYGSIVSTFGAVALVGVLLASRRPVR